MNLSKGWVSAIGILGVILGSRHSLQAEIARQKDSEKNAYLLPLSKGGKLFLVDYKNAQLPLVIGQEKSETKGSQLAATSVVLNEKVQVSWGGRFITALQVKNNQFLIAVRTPKACDTHAQNTTVSLIHQRCAVEENDNHSPIKIYWLEVQLVGTFKTKYVGQIAKTNDKFDLQQLTYVEQGDHADLYTGFYIKEAGTQKLLVERYQISTQQTKDHSPVLFLDKTFGQDGGLVVATMAESKTPGSANSKKETSSLEPALKLTAAVIERTAKGEPKLAYAWQQIRTTTKTTTRSSFVGYVLPPYKALSAIPIKWSGCKDIEVTAIIPQGNAETSESTMSSEKDYLLAAATVVEQGTPKGHLTGETGAILLTGNSFDEVHAFTLAPELHSDVVIPRVLNKKNWIGVNPIFTGASNGTYGGELKALVCDNIALGKCAWQTMNTNNLEIFVTDFAVLTGEKGETTLWYLGYRNDWDQTQLHPTYLIKEIATSSKQTPTKT